MKIRDAQITDVPSILEIYNHAILHTTATFDLEVQTLKEREEWFSHYGGKYPLIVAEIDGRVVGYSCLSVFRTKPAYSQTVENSVYVHHDFRGRGIGKTLAQEILQRAVQCGFHVVIAGITADNAISIRMHEELGFKYVGCFQEVGFKFNRWHDVCFYQLTL